MAVGTELRKKLKDYVYDIVGCCQQVHREMGPWLNEYMYQEALEYALQDSGIEHQKEYYFQVQYKGRPIKHKHYIDFLVKGNVCLECKAVERLCDEHRQQLWNYMRLTNTRVGILYNFAPVNDQCEKYYYDPEDKSMSGF